MNQVPALVVAVPLLAAAAIIGLRPLVRRIWAPIVDVVAIVIGAFVVALCVLLLRRALVRPDVYWFGGFTPLHGIAIGVDFVAGPLSAGFALLVSVLMLAALVYSWRYFDIEASLYHSLMLSFLGGMLGFVLSGDLFDMFVFFELMGVSAYSLTAFRVEEKGPLQGALNFAISNSVGAFVSLTGIALVYSATGTLNLAQVGAALAFHHQLRLAMIGFGLVAVGLLAKAAVFPFHFWLPDAHAVAPTPVCLLFSGCMVELGIYGLARVYWTAFATAAAPARLGVQLTLLVLATLTVVVGALMCLNQHHLKRLLAFSTMSHAGVMLAGVATLNSGALAGVALYVLGHAGIKGGLFLCTGTLLRECGSVEEADLFGRGRSLWPVGLMMAVLGLALAALPPFALWAGESLLDDGAGAWKPWVLGLGVVAAISTGGTVLRAVARVFAGWGTAPEAESPADEAANEETSESGEGTGPKGGPLPPSLWIPIAGLGLVAMLAGVWTGVRSAVIAGARFFTDSAAYAGAVLHGAGSFLSAVTPLSTDAEALSLGVACGVAALGVAAVQIWRRPRLVGRAAGTLNTVLGPVRSLQSGHIGDYVTWITVGTAAVAGSFLLAAH